MEKIDAGEHLPLISRVIGQMGLRGDEAEEAFSEGLISITEAAQSFDPSKGVPLANWLAKNINWDLKTWRAKLHHHISIEQHDFLNPTSRLDSTVEFKELIEKMEHILSYQERQILLADAYGYSGKRIAEVMGISQVQVSKLKKKAQNKLRKEEINSQ